MAKEHDTKLSSLYENFERFDRNLGRLRVAAPAVFLYLGSFSTLKALELWSTQDPSNKDTAGVIIPSATLILAANIALLASSKFKESRTSNASQIAEREGRKFTKLNDDELRRTRRTARLARKLSPKDNYPVPEDNKKGDIEVDLIDEIFNKSEINSSQERRSTLISALSVAEERWEEISIDPKRSAAVRFYAGTKLRHIRSLLAKTEVTVD